jgi:hypothetical protein
VHISSVPSPPTSSVSSSVSSLRIFVRSSRDQSSVVADQTEFLPCTYPQCLLLPLILYPHCVSVCPGERDLGFSSSRSNSRRRRRLPRANLTNRNSSNVQLEHAHAILKAVSECLHFEGGKDFRLGTCSSSKRKFLEKSVCNHSNPMMMMIWL